jgi:uncharacterized RDD family membrane protein YckC
VTADRRRPSSRKPRSPRAARPPQQPGRALSRGPVGSGRPAAPPSGRARPRVERASATPLVLLTRAPRWLLAVVVAAVLVAGLAVRGPVGAALLLALGVFLAWLLALAWPALPPRGRWTRVAVVLIVLGAAGWQLFAGG